MTTPDQPDRPAPVPDSAPPRLRAGQPVTYRHHDTITGTTLAGTGIVARAGSDGEHITVLPLGLHHLELAADEVQPVRVVDVLPAALTQPDTATTA